MCWKQLFTDFERDITETFRLIQLFYGLNEFVFFVGLQNHMTGNFRVKVTTPFSFTSATSLKHFFNTQLLEMYVFTTMNTNKPTSKFRECVSVLLTKLEAREKKLLSAELFTLTLHTSQQATEEF